MNVLDFICVGPPRSGTTWIDLYLRDHPSVSLPLVAKETFFFDRYFERGLPWYWQTFFSEATEPRRFGEISPTYISSAAARERIREAFPGCRIVVSVRDPAARCHSHYLNLLRLGGVPPSTTFREALSSNPEIIETSRYATHVRSWQDDFGDDRVHLLSFASLRADPGRFARQICEAIEIPFVEPTPKLFRPVHGASRPRPNRISHVARRVIERLRRSGHYDILRFGRKMGLERWLFPDGGTPARLEPEDKSYLLDLLRNEIRSTEDLLGAPYSDWEEPAPRTEQPA